MRLIGYDGMGRGQFINHKFTTEIPIDLPIIH